MTIYMASGGKLAYQCSSKQQLNAYYSYEIVRDAVSLITPVVSGGKLAYQCSSKQQLNVYYSYEIVRDAIN